MLETLIASAGIPIIGDLIKRIAGKYIGPAVDSESDIKKLQALAALDSVGDTYKWVNAIRALMRPIVCFAVLATWVASNFTAIDPQIYLAVTEMSGAVIFYLFGERTLFHLRKQG